MADDQHYVDSKVDFICPFCHLKASAGYDETDTPVVLHEMPMCEVFEKASPIQYLAACRRKRST